jgi:hypothetical protein
MVKATTSWLRMTLDASTGQAVIAFMSANHLEPDMAVEIFVLESLDAEAPSEPARPV